MLSPNFSPFPELTTKRLFLRQMTLQDAPGIHALRSNVAVMQYINRPLSGSIEDAQAWIIVILEALAKNNGITWGMYLKDNPGEIVGTVGLWRIEPENYRAEIGYMLQPSLQGKGLMLEALQQVLDYGFRQIKLHSIEAHIDARNTASVALARKAGFVQEAYFKENCMMHGQFTDTVVYSLLTPFREASQKETMLPGFATRPSS